MDSGADPSISNKNGVTPKQLADRSRNPAIMSCLGYLGPFVLFFDLSRADRPRAKAVEPAATVAVGVGKVETGEKGEVAVEVTGDKEKAAVDLDGAIDSANRQNIHERLEGGVFVPTSQKPSSERNKTILQSRKVGGGTLSRHW